MITLEFFVVCRSISRDIYTDEITLNSVLDEVELEPNGVTHIPLTVAIAMWNIDETSNNSRGDELQLATLEVTPPGLSSTKFSAKLSANRKRLRAIFAIEEIPVVEHGILTFKVSIESCPGATHQVHIVPPRPRRNKQVMPNS